MWGERRGVAVRMLFCLARRILQVYFLINFAFPTPKTVRPSIGIKHAFESLSAWNQKVHVLKHRKTKAF